MQLDGKRQKGLCRPATLQLRAMLDGAESPPFHASTSQGCARPHEDFVRDSVAYYWGSRQLIVHPPKA